MVSVRIRIECCSPPNWHNVRYIVLLTIVLTKKLRNHESCADNNNNTNFRHNWIRARSAQTQTHTHNSQPAYFSLDLFQFIQIAQRRITLNTSICHFVSHWLAGSLTRWLTAGWRTHTHIDLQIDSIQFGAKSCTTRTSRRTDRHGNWFLCFISLDFHAITVLHQQQGSRHMAQGAHHIIIIYYCNFCQSLIAVNMN